jgi:hypothetical protein
MAWLAVLKRTQVAFSLVRDVLANKLSGLDLVLRRSYRGSFVKRLRGSLPSWRPLLLSFSRRSDPRCFTCCEMQTCSPARWGKGAPYARIKRPSLSPQAQQVVAHDNPELLEGFLIYRPRLRTAKLSRAKKAAKPSANTLNLFGIL